MRDEILMERMTWTEIQAAMNDGYDTSVLFTGSIEQHGPHLPLATDTMCAYALAERVARRLGHALVAPVIRPGVSEHHMAFPGTVTLSPATFKAVVDDCVQSLARHGFRRIVVSWAHGGNTPALQEVLPEIAARNRSVELLAQADVPAFFARWKPYAEAEGIDLGTLGIHGGEGETSMMLAHAPNDVRVDRLEAGFTGDLVSDPAVFANLLATGLRSFTENGILGDARRADRARGERYLDVMATYLADALAPVEPRAAPLP
jgi:creatinine amidohydrolase